MTGLLLNDSSLPPQLPPSIAKTKEPAKKSVPPRVLVVDDERIIANTIVEILNRSGFIAEAAYGGSQAIERARVISPDLVLSDVMMPDLDGVEASIAIREICPEARIVLFSGNATTAELLLLAHKRGHDFELLAKPLHPIKLIEYLQQRT